MSGCTDHTTDSAPNAVNASSSPTGHSPYLRPSTSDRVAGVSTIATATVTPAARVSTISVMVIDSRLSPPLATNVIQHATAAVSSVVHHSASARSIRCSRSWRVPGTDVSGAGVGGDGGESGAGARVAVGAEALNEISLVPVGSDTVTQGAGRHQQQAQQQERHGREQRGRQ